MYLKKVAGSKQLYQLGESKLYECSNHLGNVVVTISDKKLGQITNLVQTKAQYYQAIVKTASDYYPFGWQMPNRKLNTENYSFGFNGQVQDAEWMGGQSVAFEFRTQDTRLGRFLSTDPLTATTPWETPYAFAGNSPIRNIDWLGLSAQSVVEPPPAGNSTTPSAGGRNFWAAVGEFLSSVEPTHPNTPHAPAITQSEMQRVVQNVKDDFSPIDRFKRRVARSKRRKKRRAVLANNKTVREVLRGSRINKPNGGGGKYRLDVGPNGGITKTLVKYPKASGGNRRIRNYNQTKKRIPPGTYGNSNSWFVPKQLKIKQAYEIQNSSTYNAWIWDTRFSNVGTNGTSVVRGITVPTISYNIPVQSPIFVEGLYQNWFPASGYISSPTYQMIIIRDGVELGNVLSPSGAGLSLRGGDVLKIVPVVSDEDLDRLSKGKNVRFDKRINEPYIRFVGHVTKTSSRRIIP